MPSPVLGIRSLQVIEVAGDQGQRLVRRGSKAIIISCKQHLSGIVTGCPQVKTQNLDAIEFIVGGSTYRDYPIIQKQLSATKMACIDFQESPPLLKMLAVYPTVQINK